MFVAIVIYFIVLYFSFQNGKSNGICRKRYNGSFNIYVRLHQLCDIFRCQRSKADDAYVSAVMSLRRHLEGMKLNTAAV